MTAILQGYAGYASIILGERKPAQWRAMVPRGTLFTLYSYKLDKVACFHWTSPFQTLNRL